MEQRSGNRLEAGSLQQTANRKMAISCSGAGTGHTANDAVRRGPQTPARRKTTESAEVPNWPAPSSALPTGATAIGCCPSTLLSQSPTEWSDALVSLAPAISFQRKQRSRVNRKDIRISNVGRSGKRVRVRGVCVPGVPERRYNGIRLCLDSR